VRLLGATDEFAATAFKIVMQEVSPAEREKSKQELEDMARRAGYR